MNTIAKIVALLVVLTAVFSFSQENLSEPAEKPIVYDTITIHRIISDSVTIEALKNSQEFYSNSFYYLLSILAITIAILGFLNTRTEKNLGQEVKNQLNLFKEELEIIRRQNKETEEILRKEREKNQDDFNAAHAKIAEIYYISARDELFAIKQGEKEEYENEHWFRHFICLASFYSALTKMSKFSSNELHFIRFVKKFPDEYNKNVPMPDIKFFHHLLLFIEHSEKIDAVIFEETKITYNKLLKTLDYDKVIEHIKTIGFGKERTETLLKLAEYYRDKGYLEKYNFDKL